MKYCPYCGADIIDGAVSFCVECGKELPVRKQKENQETIPERKPPGTKKKKSKKKKQTPISDAELRSEYDEGYDGYYEDLLPVDDALNTTTDRLLAQEFTSPERVYLKEIAERIEKYPVDKRILACEGFKTYLDSLEKFSGM